MSFCVSIYFCINSLFMIKLPMQVNAHTMPILAVVFSLCITVTENEIQNKIMNAKRKIQFLAHIKWNMSFTFEQSDFKSKERDGKPCKQKSLTCCMCYARLDCEQLLCHSLVSCTQYKRSSSQWSVKNLHNFVILVNVKKVNFSLIKLKYVQFDLFLFIIIHSERSFRSNDLVWKCRETI